MTKAPDPSVPPPPAAAPRRWWTRRAEWAIRLMRLPVSADPPDAPGVLMIQIDGLARAEAERAIAAGRMPVLARLQDGKGSGQGWRLADFYAGLPASTPAVQGELFYGVPTAVPAFSFVDRASGAERRMYDPDAAKAVEARLAETGPGLLAGGSAYGDIYTGGAGEAHFCAASLGLSDLAKTVNPLALVGLFLSNLVTVVRTLVLAGVEVGLALADAARGMVALGELWQELKFVPTRVAIAVLMRDALTVGAGIDLARGLPVVHVNFLGYDEQAHRRGPQSAFAHWALKGIDRAAGRLIRSADRSPRRRYRVVVYSDHGQLAVTPYPECAGRTIEEAVAAVLRRQGDGAPGPAAPDGRERGEQTGRAGYLGGRRLQRLFPAR
ncbi:MAG: oxidoreductase, partial [Alphaproteobacteria bacterium]|nr:oxidoreductase [Alphaproteobacteria bacterium]